MLHAMAGLKKALRGMEDLAEREGTLLEGLQSMDDSITGVVVSEPCAGQYSYKVTWGNESKIFKSLDSIKEWLAASWCVWAAWGMCFGIGLERSTAQSSASTQARYQHSVPALCTAQAGGMRCWPLLAMGDWRRCSAPCGHWGGAV